MKIRYLSFSYLNCIAFFSLFYFLNFNASAQLKVKASGLVAKEDEFYISFKVPPTNDECYDIAKVELLNVSTQKVTVLNMMKGDIAQLRVGEHQIIWNFKENNFFTEDEFDVFIYLKPGSCQSTVFNPPVNTVPIMIDATHKPHSLVLKLLTGTVGVASGLLAYSLKNNYDTKLSAFNSVEQSIMQNNGIINNEIVRASDFATYSKAYEDLKSAKNTGLINTLVATSILSLGFEVFLLTTKVKIKESNISLKPSTKGYGLSFVYRIK